MSFQLFCGFISVIIIVLSEVILNDNIQTTMSTDFDQISASITQEQKRIHQNQQQRNKRFNQCLQAYLNHLKQETHRLDSTEEQNDARNEMISSAFENVYERIMTSSQVALRKVKETCYEKKEFWDKLIKNNAELTDLEFKKDLYVQKKDAEQRYEEAIQNQKAKKIPYELLLGKLKQNQSLKEWQANNKKLQQEVVKGTKTMKQWHISEDNKPTVPYFKGTTINNDSNYFINQFQTQGEGGSSWNRAPLIASRYNSTDQPSILTNFQFRKQ